MEINPKRYFKENDDEIDITIRNFSYSPNNSVKKIDHPKKSHFIINMILDKYRSDIGSLLNISSSTKNLITNEFKNIKIDNVILCWDTSKKNETTFLCLNVNNVFGVDTESETYNKPLNNVIKDGFYTNKLNLQDKNTPFKKASINALIKDLLQLKTEEIKLSNHPIYHRGIIFREDYLRVLFAMVAKDKKVYASEISTLYEYAKFFNLSNETFLSIIENGYPYDANESLTHDESFFDKLIQLDLQYIFIKDLINIVYADKKRVLAETKLVEAINKNLKIDENIIKYFYKIYDNKNEEELNNYQKEFNNYLTASKMYDKSLIDTLIKL